MKRAPLHVCRTDNIVKNRYNANLRSTVVAPREKAVAVCEAGKANNKHWGILESYITGLCEMRDWVLNTQDIVSPNLPPCPHTHMNTHTLLLPPCYSPPWT